MSPPLGKLVGVDQDVRLLERQAVTDPAARAAWLRARVRSGSLSEDMLLLASKAGDRDAALALGQVWTPPKSRLLLWPFGKEAGVFAAVAAGQILVPLWARLNLTVAVEAVTSAETWLACPCEDHRRAAGRAATAVDKASPGQPYPSITRTAGSVARAAARIDRTENERRASRLRAQRDAYAAVEHVLAFRLVQLGADTARAVEDCRLSMLTKREVDDMVTGAVRAWALRPVESSPVPG